MKSELGIVREELTNLKDESTHMKSELGIVRKELTHLKDESTHVKSELVNVREELKGQGQRFISFDNKMDLLTLQTTNAVRTLSDKLNSMDKKLDLRLVSEYEIDFVSEKIQYLEREIFKLKQQ